MIVETLFYLPVFILGTIIGSFLNVLILRYNTGVSAMKGRSFCFSCGKKLGPLELIPVLSFILQRGKCRGCQSKISWQYPLIEGLTGALFVAVFMKYFGLAGLLFNPWLVLIALITVAVLIVITVYDIRHKIIPDGLVVAFGIMAVLKILADYLLLDLTPAEMKIHLLSYLLAGPILALPLFLIWLISRGRWMGLGDPKLVLGIGWFLGPVLGLSAIILAFWIGAGYGLILMILSKFHWHGLHIDRKTEVPFAPFLILGFLLVFFFSFDILGLASLIP
jgi:prepilin signal peptidase PulO-like enzyme (type II secretory pathway)